jgi:PAS domain S-box-containing protein
MFLLSWLTPLPAWVAGFVDASLITLLVIPSLWFFVHRPMSLEISERLRTEGALRESEQRLRVVTQTAADAIVSADNQGNIILWNTAAEHMFGYPATEALGKPLAIIMPERLQQAHSRAMSLSAAAGRAQFASRFMELVGVRKGGAEFPLEISIASWSGESGTCFTGVIRDISKRKEAEAALRKAQAELLEKSRLAGMAEVATAVLHNVGNVLNGVMVSASIMSESFKRSKVKNLGRAVDLMRRHSGDLCTFLTQDPKGRELPGYFVHLSEHLLQEQCAIQAELRNLQEGLDHVCKIVSRQQAYAKTPGVVEVLDVVETVEETLRAEAEPLKQQQVALVREYEAGRSKVLAERHKLVQVLTNLIRNASQACVESRHPAKQVVLRVSTESERVRVAIMDNGIGVVPENQVRIFNYGFSTWKSDHGFSLHSCALAIQGMGGVLKVESGGLGQGATFILELPVVEPLYRDTARAGALPASP